MLVSLIGAVAWPLASLAIAALWRRELRLALNRLAQLKYGTMEVTFREDLRQAEALAQSLPTVASPGKDKPASAIQFEIATDAGPEPAGTLLQPEGPPAPPPLGAVELKTDREKRRASRSPEALVRACRESPRAGILEAWDDLARSLMATATHLGDRRAAAPVRVEPALRFLVDRGWLGAAEGRLVERLRLLADQVERRDGPAPGLDDAQRFVELVAPLLDRLAGLE